jgi:hypothetical protein
MCPKGGLESKTKTWLTGKSVVNRLLLLLLLLFLLLQMLFLNNT